MRAYVYEENLKKTKYSKWNEFIYNDKVKVKTFWLKKTSYVVHAKFFSRS